MTATRQDIERWLEEATLRNSRWLIVGCDNYDHENYPIYMEDDAKALWERVDHIGDNGTGGMGDSVQEIYDMHMSVSTQLGERRAWHPPARP